MDQEEYNFAYAARLRSEGWVVEEGQIEGGNPHGGPRGVSAEEDGGNDSDCEFAVDVLAREKQATSENDTIGDVKDDVGKLVHVAGVPYLVDCNETGSDPGTPSTPCFPSVENDPCTFSLAN